MTLTATCFATLLGGVAIAQQDSTFLLQSSVSKIKRSGMFWTQFGSTFVEGSFGIVPENAPTWCKNETQLTWKQRKERMEQHLTLDWAKKMVKQMLEQNETVPEWMDKTVSDDEQRGKTKWAVQESTRLKSEGKDTPTWMGELVQEDAKWANRWAACKAAELKATGEDAPAWMVENARRGITDYAAEKAQELQEEIDELDEEKEKEMALVRSQGDVVLASEKMLARSKTNRARSTAQQYNFLQKALEELDLAEQEFGRTGANAHKLKHAIIRAEEENNLLNQMISRKMDMLKAEMEPAA